MKKIISLTALVFLFACFMTGCNMVKSGERAVEQGVQGAIWGRTFFGN